MGVAGQGVCTRGKSLGLHQRPVEGEAGASVCTVGPRCMPPEQQTLVWPVAQVMKGGDAPHGAVVVLRPRHWRTGKGTRPRGTPRPAGGPELKEEGMPERPGRLGALVTGSRRPQLADGRPGAQVVAGWRELARQEFA